uniref:UBA domain-containing protein n=1 Tax=Oryzias sinensis TaxID=183150 RepID=A0A8C7WY32_9TELE
MTSLVSNHTRGTRDKTLPVATQTTQPQKQIQATAEQIRLAQVIYDKNDADFEDKVKQLIEVTGKTQDECMVALHDCNEDVNRAINFLLESTSDTVRATRETFVYAFSCFDTKIMQYLHYNPCRRSEENGFEMAPGERALDRGRGGRGRGEQ